MVVCYDEVLIRESRYSRSRGRRLNGQMNAREKSREHPEAIVR